MTLLRLHCILWNVCKTGRHWLLQSKLVKESREKKREIKTSDTVAVTKLLTNIVLSFPRRSFWPPLPLGRQLRGKAKLSLLLPVHPFPLLPHHLYLCLRHHPRHSEWVTLTAHAGSHSTLRLSGMHRDLRFSLHAFSIATAILIVRCRTPSPPEAVYSIVRWLTSVPSRRAARFGIFFTRKFETKR